MEVFKIIYVVGAVTALIGTMLHVNDRFHSRVTLTMIAVGLITAIVAVCLDTL